jgi:hypothetical protein
MKMRADVRMTDQQEFHVSSWWAKSPEYVVAALQAQLEAAQSVWPELKQYSVAKRRDRSKAEPAPSLTQTAAGHEAGGMAESSPAGCPPVQIVR